MSPCVRPPTNTTRMQRGAACVCCRQKKTKCDGLRPCSRCAKLKRGDECAYEEEPLTDPKEPLELKMQQLETRLWNLESTQAPTSYPLRVVRSPSSRCISKPAASLMQPQDLFSSLPGYPTTVAQDSPITPNTKHSDTDIELHTAFLFDAFFHHKFRIGWNFHADPSSLYSWILDPTQSRGPHPSLLYAIRLVSLTYYPQWASSPGYFLTRALQETALGIVTADDRVMNLIQASCLLATYFYSRNRIQEGYFHSSNAARLASSRLLAFSSSKVRDSWPEEFATLSQALAVDRAWAVTSGLPSVFNDGDLWVGSSPVSSWSVGDLQEYVNTVAGFYADGLFAANPNMLWNKVLALRTGACIAYEMSYRISTNHLEDAELQLNRGHLESALESFKAIVPAFHRRSGAQIEPLDLQLVTIHTFIHTSCLHLQRNSIVNSPESRKNCLLAVESITAIIQQLTEADYRNLDAILSSCWLGAAYICLHLITLSLPLKLSAIIQIYLGHLLHATKELGKTYPLADLHARQMEFAWMTLHSSTVSSSVGHRSL